MLSNTTVQVTTNFRVLLRSHLELTTKYDKSISRFPEFTVVKLTPEERITSQEAFIF